MKNSTKQQGLLLAKDNKNYDLFLDEKSPIGFSSSTSSSKDDNSNKYKNTQQGESKRLKKDRKQSSRERQLSELDDDRVSLQPLVMVPSVVHGSTTMSEPITGTTTTLLLVLCFQKKINNNNRIVLIKYHYRCIKHSYQYKVISVIYQYQNCKAGGIRLKQHVQSFLVRSKSNGDDDYSGGVDAILLDLGVSSYQINTTERRFSYRYNGPLDMKMSNDISLTAADICNELEDCTGSSRCNRRRCL
jgi:MraW methylase family